MKATTNLKVGDRISVRFADDHPYVSLRGKSFVGIIGMVNNNDKEYGVHLPYGPDYISFSEAKPLVVKDGMPVECRKCNFVGDVGSLDPYLCCPNCGTFDVII